MTEPQERKPLREGQAHKRAAILTAARSLFVESGVERTSMDAVAARAGVSKRTVYDYYGDKHRLLLGVIEHAGESALTTLRDLVGRHLADDAVTTPADLRAATEGLAVALGRVLLRSTDYLAAARLIAENEPLLPELVDHPLEQAHDQVLAEALGRLADRGLLDAHDPLLAAAHFQALTILRALNEPPRRRADAAHVERIMTDGAEVFLRAYAARGDTSR